ncbi:MAG: ferredoxin [Candidatus Woesearchaeota archaeon]
MKVSVDKNTCIGCGACAAIASDIFIMGDDTKAEVKKGMEKVPSGKEVSAKEGADSCPVSAIRVE